MTVRYGGELRILIVGGGIAGLTLAALLRQRGFHPEIVEKAEDYGGVGYVIGLWPAGSSVLKGLGLFRVFVAAGQEFTDYTVADGQGNVLHHYDFRALGARSGPAYLLQRSALVAILRQGIGDTSLRFGTTVVALDENGGELRAAFDDGSVGVYDLVVGADGIHSQVRRLIFGDAPLEYQHMTSWAFWIDPALAARTEVTEYWGAGRFFGVYPAKDALCCFVVAAARANQPDPVAQRIDRIRATFKPLGGVVPRVLADLPDPQDIWHDDFYDLKLPQWRRGRIVLIGDAGAAILPTAGIGASMAMESAAALADELSRADSLFLEHSLERFIARRRARVDRVQKESRTLARYALVDHPLAAKARDLIVRSYSQRRMERRMADMVSATL